MGLAWLLPLLNSSPTPTVPLPPLRPLTLPPRELMPPDSTTDTTASTDTTTDTTDTPDTTTVTTATPTVVSLLTPTVLLPPLRPPRFWLLRLSTSPPMPLASPTPLPASLPTPMVPLSPLSPPMFKPPVPNTWLPTLKNQLVM